MCHHVLLLPRSQRVGASSVLSVGKGKFLRTSGELRNSYCEAVNISPSDRVVCQQRRHDKKEERLHSVTCGGGISTAL